MRNRSGDPLFLLLGCNFSSVIRDLATGYREHYIRDAQGNVMATYRYEMLPVNEPGPGFESSLKLTDRPIYGTSRLGVDAFTLELGGIGPEDPNPYLLDNPIGLVKYELTDQLGNVAAVITDELLGVNVDGGPENEYFQPNLISASLHEQFGMNLTGMNWQSDVARFGFQSQLKDTELGMVNFKYRQYDPAGSGFLSVDPLSGKYPHNSPYAFSENRVVDGVELEGLEVDLISSYVQRMQRFMNEMERHPDAGIIELLVLSFMAEPVVQVSVGFVPVAGQAVDGYDTYSAFHGGSGWDKAFAMAAWVPGGDLFKVLRKTFKNADEFRSFRHVGDNLPLGAQRENLVAGLSGGGVAKGLDGRDLKITVDVDGKKTSATVDVLGNKGELITVGGPSKANKPGEFGDHLSRLKQVADQNGVKAQAYLAEGTPQETLDLARKHLGKENVFTFKDPQ